MNRYFYTFESVEYLGESAVTVLLELLFQTAPKSISDCEIRCPSHVRDIASVCLGLMERKLAKTDDIKGIFILFCNYNLNLS